MKKIKTQSHIHISFKEWIFHYNIVLFVLLVPMFSVISLFEFHITNTYDGVRHPNEMFLDTSIFYIPAIILFIYERGKLKLRKFNAIFNDNQFNAALKKTVQEQKWHYISNSKGVLKFFTDKDGVGEYGGDLITIIKLNNQILINSIEKISINTSFFQHKKNNQNIMMFMRNLDKIIKN